MLCLLRVTVSDLHLTLDILWRGLPWWLSGGAHLPMQEMWVRSLGQEDPLEKDMVTHSSILAWEIPQTEGPGGLQSVGSQESDTHLELQQQFDEL